MPSEVNLPSVPGWRGGMDRVEATTMSERSFVDYITHGLKANCAPCSVTKHADQWTPGIADLSFRVGGVNGWVELKDVPKLPVRAETRVRFGSEFTTAQALFLLERDGKLLIRVPERKLYLGMTADWAWEMQRDGGWALAAMRTHAAEWSRKIDWRELSEWLSTKTL